MNLQTALDVFPAQSKAFDRVTILAFSFVARLVLLPQKS